jgi:hypothetical protein
MAPTASKERNSDIEATRARCPKRVPVLRRFAGLALGAFLIGPGAQSADLSAPINTTPTLGSEIKRGIDAAFSQCPNSFDPLAFPQCVFAIEGKNRQKVVEYQPFDLGLFFEAWIRMDVAGFPSQELQSDLAQSHYTSARRQAKAMYGVFRDYQTKLGVTDEQLISLSDYKKDHLRQRLEYWSKMPPQ